MSRDTKRTWSEQVEETIVDDGKHHVLNTSSISIDSWLTDIETEQILGEGDLVEKMQPDSRENSSNRKKSKPNTDFKHKWVRRSRFFKYATWALTV